MAHWKQPNLNTLLGLTGAASLVLREALGFNLFNLQHHMRGMVGTNVGEFRGRLLTLSLISLVVAAFAKID